MGSQCTYRCVVLPDGLWGLSIYGIYNRLNAPTGAWCSLTAPFWQRLAWTAGLNAPTGAWCSLTILQRVPVPAATQVSMHLQVRGAP